MSLCDRISVGVIIEGSDDSEFAGEADTILMFNRVKAPVGVAPVAGHLDGHGNIIATAFDEADEEVSLRLYELRSVIEGRWRDNVCSRQRGQGKAGHTWWVERAYGIGVPKAKHDESANLHWYHRDEIHDLALRTHMYAHGLVSDEEWLAQPGLEPVWAAFLVEGGFLSPLDLDLAAIDELSMGLPSPRF